MAKVAGVEAEVRRWQAREYDAYVDVFNTTITHPIERGVSVRIGRRGGAIMAISPWEAVGVNNGPSDTALERTPALHATTGRAARLKARR